MKLTNNVRFYRRSEQTRHSMQWNSANIMKG